MASNTYNMNTWGAKRIFGDTHANLITDALLQITANNTWILSSGRQTNYGIKYVYDSSTDHDKIEFYGGYQVNSADAPTAWVQLDTGDVYILGQVGINHAPDTYQLYVDGTSYFDDDITVEGNVVPNQTNTYTLGTSSLRWSKLYVGTADSYGSTIQPIYWNAGIPGILGTIGGQYEPVWVDDGTVTAITAGTNAQFYRGDKTWSNDLVGSLNLQGNLTFSNSGTAFRGINYGTMGDNDQWRIGGAATAANAGYMEIATADDGTEPIYVRQYTGVFSTLKRTLTLLDANGYMLLPSYINVPTSNNENPTVSQIIVTNGSDSYYRKASIAHVTSAVDAQRTFVRRAGDSMTGALTFANNTWNVVGDDCAMGDVNVAGALAIKGQNGTTNLRFVQYNASAAAAIAWDGTRFNLHNCRTVFEYNNSWLSPSRVEIGRYDGTANTDRAVIGVTNGNLHLDAYKGYALYLNHYCSAGNVYFNGSTYYINGGTYNGNAATATTASGANVLNINNTMSLSNCLQYIQTSAQTGNNDLPTSAWWHCIKMNHGNGGTYYKRVLAFNFWGQADIRTATAEGNGSTTAWKRVWCEGNSVTSAVWNDYAECRETQAGAPGQCVYELGDDTLAPTTERMQPAAGIISDTWGFSQGETETAKTPIAVAGRVLAYTYRCRDEYKPGDALCAAPGGTVDIMTRDEIREYPDRIVGIVSCVPDYEYWGAGEGSDRKPVEVDGRIWIKVH